MIKIENLTMSFGHITALKDISAQIPRGKIVGIVGHDGAGKTTLIRLIAGLLKPDQGSIHVREFDSILDARYIHTLSSYVPQKFGFYGDLTIKQNLDLYAGLRNVPQKDRAEIYSKLLEFMGLSEFQDRYAKQLSGGMKQKLGLACALVKEPELLLLDEPSVGVDPISRRELWKIAKSLVEKGISIIWNTSYLDEAEQCDHILLLNEGKLIYEGAPQILTERAKDRVFAVTNIEQDTRTLLFDLLKDQNVVDGTIKGKDLRLVMKSPDHILPDLQTQKVDPQFEDAFIDLLGGGPKEKSTLADNVQIHGNGDAMIKAENLIKKYGDFAAVDDISLEIKQGEVFGLLGPNGAGKTTTFKMLCGLSNATSGKTLVNGVDLRYAKSEARSHIGYMAQKFSLYDNLTVQQNLNFFAGAYDLYGEQKQKAIDEMIEVFNLKDYLQNLTKTLSLGYKQRLSLACAQMHRPAILFLDEPTSGVDPLTRREFWNHIHALVQKKVTVMITTHFMDEAEFCDRIALIYRGKVIKMDSPEGLKKEIQSEELPKPTLSDVFVHTIERYNG